MLLQISIQLSPSSEGGRLSAISLGYRPTVRFVNRNGSRCCSRVIEIISPEGTNVDSISPGQAAVVVLKVARVTAFEDFYVIGEPIVFEEGTRVIGEGKIQRIVED